jgi:prostaglandin-endoperoxide synthase 2
MTQLESPLPDAMSASQRAKKALSRPRLIESRRPDAKSASQRATHTLGRADFLASLPTRFGPVWRFLQSVPALERVVNRRLINHGINLLPPRPYRLTTKADFTSADTLSDKTFNSRQLPPTDSLKLRTTPDPDEVLELFRRKEFIPCEKSTVLFAYLAQWFTDGFLRSDRSVVGKDERDITKNESTHEIDLAQLYGLTPEVTAKLRHRDQPMLLAYQEIGGEHYPPDLFSTQDERAPGFETLRVIGTEHVDVDNRQLLAMGSDVSNSQIGYAMLNTLFLREHNDIARQLAVAEGSRDWSQARIFAAARNVLTVLLIKVVIEEYINHIHPYHFQFRLDPRGFDRQPWMRPNWTAVEFNLLYRWHSLIPDNLLVGDDFLPLKETTFHTKHFFERHGLAALIHSASRQRAGRIGLRNTPEMLLYMVERPSILAGRKVRLRGYNQYRQACGFPRATSFEDISSDRDICAALREVHGHVDEIEFYTGLFAEDTRPNSVLPPLMGRLVGMHAFSQLLTNPLFAPDVHNEQTFSRRGLEIIDQTKSLADIVRRNVRPGREPMVKLTRAGWKRI